MQPLACMASGLTQPALLREQTVRARQHRCTNSAAVPEIKALHETGERRMRFVRTFKAAGHLTM